MRPFWDEMLSLFGMIFMVGNDRSSDRQDHCQHSDCCCEYRPSTVVRAAESIRRRLTMLSDMLNISQTVIPPACSRCLGPTSGGSDTLASHVPGRWYLLAPLRNATMASELLMPKSCPIEFDVSNHTNPGRP